VGGKQKKKRIVGIQDSDFYLVEVEEEKTYCNWEIVVFSNEIIYVIFVFNKYEIPDSIFYSLLDSFLHGFLS
jgi:hypothetical protein